MQRRALTFGLAALLMVLAAPASTRQPTLLETWVWLELGGKVEIAAIKQQPGDILHLKKGLFAGTANIDTDITYAVVDRTNCVIRQSIPSANSRTVVYLNNFLPTLQIIEADGGGVDFSIASKTRTHCVTEARGTLCLDTMHFHAADEEAFQRMQDALRQVFTKFCTYAGAPRAPATSSAWTTIVK